MTPEAYNAAYFIAKFEAIPEEKWIMGSYGYEKNGPHCALGHCGAWRSAEDPDAEALRQLCYKHRGTSPTAINDGRFHLYRQPTPKQRILAWLRNAQEAGL